MENSSRVTDPGPIRLFFGRLYFGWYIAGVCLLIYFFTNGMSIFVPQNLFPRFMETFGATAGQISLTVSITFALAAPLAPFAGALIDRYGALTIIRIGLTIMAVCFTLYPFARSVTHLYILHAGLAFGLVLGGLLVNVVLLSNWFVARRGAVIGMLVAMSSLSGLVLPNLISPLVNDPEFGWRWGLGALAAAFWIFAVLPGFFLLKERPADIGLTAYGAAATSGTPSETEVEGVPLNVALRSRTLWVLAIGSACLWFTFQAINSQISIFLELEAGLEPQAATRFYSMIFGFSIAGKFLFGAISDRFQKRHVMIVTSAILFLGCLLIFDAGSDPIQLTKNLTQLTLFTIVFGLGYGGSFTMIQLVCVESFGPRALGKILGIVICVDSIGGMLGTYLTGQMKTVTGSYLIPFSIVLVVAIIAFVSVLFVRPVSMETRA
jgi:MFS family permease